VRIRVLRPVSAASEEKEEEEAYAKLKRRGKGHDAHQRQVNVTSLLMLAGNSPLVPRLSGGDTEILWCGGKSLGVFRREIKFWEARRNDSPRALYGVTGIVLTCLSQILTQVGLARRPGTKRSRNKMRRNDPHSVHVSENQERRTSRRAAFFVVTKERQRRNERKKNSPLSFSLFHSLSFSSGVFYSITVACVRLLPS